MRPVLPPRRLAAPSLALTLVLATPAVAQDGTEEEQQASAPEHEGLAVLPWRELGPSTFGGRVVDLAVHPDHPSRIWVASASGGLWTTDNHGVTWRCVFQDEGTISIGDFALDPNDVETIWVGTGEANNQRSSYWGDGVYLTEDGGETWTHTGLPESHHVGRIVVDPTDGRRVFVAALGHLYTPNEERGLYRTTDGGETWEKVLHVNENVGVVDVVLDPADPRVVYAASYERRRRAWNFDGAGPGSAIWKSSDGGDTWRRLEGGLPTGEIGRIGLSISATDPKRVYATVSNQNRVPVREGPILGLEAEWEDGALVVTDVEEESGAAELGLAEDDVIVRIGDRAIDGPFAWMRVLASLQDDDDEGDEDEEAAEEPVVEIVVRTGDEERTIEATLSQLLVVDEEDPETRPIGGEVYRSDDGGETWERRNEDPVGGSPAYYYGQIRVDPHDDERLYLCGVPFWTSDDGGKTWDRIAGSVHVDHHAFEVDPHDPTKLYLGNDGGFHVSYDRGETWDHYTNLPIAQFYAVGLDQSVPFMVYGGTQDNGTWGGPSQSRDPRGIHALEWYTVGGGDGFYAQIDPRDPNTVYGESQFGALYRRDLRTGRSARIRPSMRGERLRFNWNSPILLSQHNPEILYFGGNRLFRSLDRGDTWSLTSPDLTTNDEEKIAGNVPHCTITTIAESALDPALLLVGTDDGNVQLSEDGGHTWTNLTGLFPGAPANWWVSRVALSRHERGTAYVSFTGYREDDFRAFVYRTDALGEGRAWSRISDGLPAEPVNVVEEDPAHPAVLYCGTEFGAYASTDTGATWEELGHGLPTIAVHDLEVHARDRTLVVATHGRGFWAIDVDALADLPLPPSDEDGDEGDDDDEAEAPPVARLLPVGDRVRWLRRPTVGGYGGGDRFWFGENPPSGVAVCVQVAEELGEDVEVALTIEDEDGETVATLDLPRTAGLHRVVWDERQDSRRRGRRGRRMRTGTFEAVLSIGEAEEQRRTFELRPDPLLDD